MKKFSEFKVGDSFFSTSSISEKELELYLKFSRIKNVFLEDMQKTKQKLISGRAILSRMEGEFTRLSQIYGNHIIFIGTDGDAECENKSVRFLNPLYINDVLKIKFTISEKKDIDEQFGKIAVNYEGTNQDGKIIVLANKNWYRIKK